MSSDPTWKGDANGVAHPTRETLLAFIREQCDEHEKNRINEHLLAGCASCNRVRADLTQSSNALNSIKQMPGYLCYPELQSSQVLYHMQRGEPLTSMWTGKRKRKFQVQHRPVRRPQAAGRYPRKAGLRYVSIPAAFAMFLLFALLVVTLVYALASLGKLPFPLPGQQSSHIYHNRQITPVVAPHQPTTTPSTSASPTPTAIVVKGPKIDYCSPSGYSGSLIFICGSGFKAGDKVSLLLRYYGSDTPVIRGSYRVDKHGKFIGVLYFYSCKNLPIEVYAIDQTLRPASVTSNVLTSIQVPGCHEPTPTSTPDIH